MYYKWKPYVSVAQRLARAIKHAQKRAKKENREPTPVKTAGRKLVSKFWGQAWCENLDRYSDFANRLPRGRTYLGNGSVVDLQIKPGRVEAIVAGSEVYEVQIRIKALPPKTWKSLQRDCGSSIHSLLDLLQGQFDEGVMQRVAKPEGGLFPQPKEIEMECSCPDYAYVCKHIAAVIYGIGVRLDTSPELLFTLRKIDHLQLIAKAASAENLEQSLAGTSGSLAGADLGELFGIDLDAAGSATAAPGKRVRKAKVAEPPTKNGAATRSKTRAKTATPLAGTRVSGISMNRRVRGRKQTVSRNT